ncbi:hypothetical protein GY45DRAFT_1336634 [Cubamyces sp. BRFM 1775]|nr:hypothetical protein GY45DRAFT_1336634 [Cubamyces sp. BRFM 1775]
MPNHASRGTVSKRHLSDDQLYERAQKHLSVLSNPLYAHHNRPAWVERVEALSRLKTEYTTARMINAMYEAATTLQLRACLRDVSVVVCACAAESLQQYYYAAMQAGEDAERLAGALERLESTWVSYMLWPFAARDSAAKELNDISSSGYPTPTAADMVPRLDDGLLGIGPKSYGKTYICVDIKKLKARGDTDLRRLTAVPSGVPRWRSRIYSSAPLHCETATKRRTWISPRTRSYSSMLYRCLKPTATPHRYQFGFMPGFVRTKPVDTHHTFYDHSTKLHHDTQPTSAPDPPPIDEPSPSSRKRDREDHSAVPLPNPKLLRMHAASAHVTHASGAAAIFNALNSLSGPGEPASVDADGGSSWRVVVEGDVARLGAAIEHIERSTGSVLDVVWIRRHGGCQCTSRSGCC